MSRGSRYGGGGSNSDCKVYIGDLGNSASKEEIEDAFSYYGPLRNVWVARNPPGFAFVEFEDPRDADDSVRAMDGKRLCGRRVRVELSNGRSKSRGYRGGGGGGGRSSARSFSPSHRCYKCGRRGHYAYDCRSSRSRSRSRSRSYSPKDSRRRRSPSNSRSRSGSRSPPPRRAASRSRSRSESPRRRSGKKDSRSRSASPAENGSRD